MHAFDINGFIKDIMFIVGVGLTIGVGGIFLVAWLIHRREKSKR